jgi:hypothetical protein
MIQRLFRSVALFVVILSSFSGLFSVSLEAKTTVVVNNVVISKDGDCSGGYCVVREDKPNIVFIGYEGCNVSNGALPGASAGSVHQICKSRVGFYPNPVTPLQVKEDFLKQSGGQTIQTDDNVKYTITDPEDPTKSIEVTCDIKNKVCQSGGLAPATFSDCTIENGKASCKTKTRGSATNTSEVLSSQTTEQQVKKSEDNTAGGITDILLNLVMAIITLIVWAAGTVMEHVLWLVIAAFVFLVRINPADSTWIQVATAPWLVIQSISNLTILGAFLYVGFGYLLNIKKLKTRIDTFLTNIIIIAVVTNMTLLGTASIINIAQGIGNVFLASYAAVTEGAAGQKEIEKAFIGGVLESFRQISEIRCGSLSSNISVQNLAVNPFVLQVDAQTTPAPAAPAQTNNGGANAGAKPADSTKSVNSEASNNECPNAGKNGPEQGFNEIGNVFKDVFSKTAGKGFEKMIREAIYLIIVIVAIFVFFKVIIIALIRALGLWFLMILSPFALAAQFSPEGFGLKKHAIAWGKAFLEFTLFYPAFILGLVLSKELTGAFNKAAKGTFDNAVGDQGNGVSTIVLVIMMGVVAIGSIYMLGNFFEKMFKKISDGVFDAAGTIGGSATRWAGAALGGAVGLAGASGSKLAQRRIDTLQERLKGVNGNDDAAKMQRALIKDQIRNAVAYKQASSKVRLTGEGITSTGKKIGNFIEMLPERRNTLEDLGKSIGEKWSRDKKARIASFKEGDRLRQELYFRKNPKIAGMLGIDPDLDPKAKLRGVDRDDMLDNLAKDPNYYKNLVDKSIKNTFDKSLGKDTAIRRDVAQKKMLRLAEKFGGDFDKMDSEARDFFEDALEQHHEDDALMSSLAGDSNALKMVRQVMGSNRLEGKTQNKIRKTSPIFIEDGRDRQKQVSAFSKKERDNLGGYNVADGEVFQGLLDSGMKVNEIAGIYNNKGYSDLSESNARKSLNTMGLDEDQKARVESFRDTQLNKGYSQVTPALISMTRKMTGQGSVSDDEMKGIMSGFASQQFGHEGIAEAVLGGGKYQAKDGGGNNVTIDLAGTSAAERIKHLKDNSAEARKYMQDNESSLSGLSEQNQLKEVVAAVTVARGSYKMNEEVLLNQLKAQSKAASKTIGKIDVATAGKRQNEKTLKQAMKNQQQIETTMRSGSTDLHRELGIDRGFSDIVDQSMQSGSMSVGSNSYNIEDVSNNQQGDLLRDHLQHIAVAAVSGNAEQFEQAKNAAKKTFEHIPEVRRMVDTEFKNVQNGLGAFDSAIVDAGNGVRQKYDQQISDKASARPDKNYAAAAREVLSGAVETAKAQRDGAATRSMSKDATISGVDIKNLAQQFGGDVKSNV